MWWSQRINQKKEKKQKSHSHTHTHTHTYTHTFTHAHGYNIHKIYNMHNKKLKKMTINRKRYGVCDKVH